MLCPDLIAKYKYAQTPSPVFECCPPPAEQERWAGDEDPVVKRTAFPWCRGFEVVSTEPEAVAEDAFDMAKLIAWGDVNYACEYNKELELVRIHEPTNWVFVAHDYSIKTGKWVTRTKFLGDYALRTDIDWQEKKIVLYKPTELPPLAFIKLNPDVMPAFLSLVCAAFL